MALITIGPRTQPDKIIKLGKNHEINLTAILALAAFVASYLFEILLAAAIINTLFRGVIPNFQFGFWNAVGFLALITLVRDYSQGKLSLVDIATDHPPSNNK